MNFVRGITSVYIHQVVSCIFIFNILSAFGRYGKRLEIIWGYLQSNRQYNGQQGKIAKGQTVMYKTLHGKLRIDQSLFDGYMMFLSLFLSLNVSIMSIFCDKLCSGTRVN